MKQLELPVKKKSNVIYVRLKPEEMQVVEELCKSRGQKVSTIVKALLLNPKAKAPLMKHEDSKTALAQLSKIGSNVNQIAKALNTGFRSGWSDAFDNFADDFRDIKKLLYSHVTN